MIVAFGAAVGEAEEDRAGDVGDIEEQLLAALADVGGVGLVGEVAIEADGDFGVEVVGVEFVAGDLFLDEAVVGLVGVQALDDVVAVAPDVWAGLVGLEAFGVGIAGEVEPVARPAFAVLGRGQKLVDDLFKGIGRRIV
jgi:hypothetical protein